MKINNTGFALYKIVIFFIVCVTSSFLLIKSASTKSETEKINTDEYNQNVHSNADYEMPVVQQNYESQRTEYYENHESKYYEFSNYVVKDNRAYFYVNPDFSAKRKAYLVINETVYIQQIINGFGFAEFTNANGKTSKGWILLENVEYCPSCGSSDISDISDIYNLTNNNSEEQNTSYRNEIQEENNLNSKAEPYEEMQTFRDNFIRKINIPEISSDVNEIFFKLSFVIEKDGSFSNFKIVSDDPYNISKEAIRVLKSMPNWKPAMKDGEPIESSFIIPFRIKL